MSIRSILENLGCVWENKNSDFPTSPKIFGVNKDKFIRRGAIGLGALAVTSLFTMAYIANKEYKEEVQRLSKQYERSQHGISNDKVKISNEVTSQNTPQSKEPLFLSYTVQEGENMYNIARSNKPDCMSTSEYLDSLIVNAVSRNEIDTTGYSETGVVIIHPGQVIDLPKIECSGCDDAKNDDQNVYEIKEGDTLWKIAQQLTSSSNIEEYIKEIVRINSLDTSDYATSGNILIKEGQKIRLPKETSGTSLLAEA